MKRQKNIFESIADTGKSGAGQMALLMGGSIVAGSLIGGVMMDALMYGLNKDDNYSAFTEMTFVPEPAEGECLYIDHDSELNIKFTGNNEFFTMTIIRWTVPFVDAKGIPEPVDLRGALPAFRTASCNVLDKDSPLVFESRADAMASIEPAVQEMYREGVKLQENYTRHERFLWEEAIKIDRSPHP